MLRKNRTSPTNGNEKTVVDRDSYVTNRTELEKLAELVKRARAQLPPLARAKTMYEQGKAVTDMGDIDGAHIVLLVAKVDMDGDGRVGTEEYARFLTEAADLIASVQSSVLNTSIVAALLLTIVLPMLLEPFDEFNEPASEDLIGTIFADAASFFTGGSSSEHAARARKGLYVAEAVLLGLTSCCCITGVFVSVAFYGAVASMPGQVAAVEFLLESCNALSKLQVLWSGCLLFLILSIPIVAAKASAVALFCAIAVSVGSLAFTQLIMLPSWRVQLRLFHEEALALVGGEALDMTDGGVRG